jgi:hypothetical protein
MFQVTDPEPRLFGEALAQSENTAQPIVVDEIDDTDDAEQQSHLGVTAAAGPCAPPWGAARGAA